MHVPPVTGINHKELQPQARTSATPQTAQAQHCLQAAEQLHKGLFDS
jgi:hypothetical protein